VKLVVGLGNPGERYRETRHNVGFMVVDLLSGQPRTTSTVDACQGRLARSRVGNEDVLLLKPQTYMNRSGRSVSEAMRLFEVGSDDLLLLHDDLDLPLGKVRVKRGGGSAGHRGLESCFAELDTKEFTRVRIGIGRPPSGGDAVEYVLDRFDEEQQEELPAALELAAEATLETISAGAVAAMNRFNRRLPDGGER